MNSTEVEQAIKDLTYPRPTDFNDKADWRIAQTEYRVEEKALEQQWKAWLIEEYAFDFSEKVQEEIFRRAWDDGHSSGYHNVENYFQEYADFANMVLQGS